MIKRILIIIYFLLTIVPSGFSQFLKFGQPAPEIKMESMLRGEPGNLDLLKGIQGKVVVLDFWTTWCSPCIKAFPHLNNLVQTFEKEPVVFLAISNEEAELVTALLDRKKLESWVGLDTDLSIFKAYNAWAIPKTVVIDKDGNLAAVLHPTDLSEPLIRLLLAGKKLNSNNFKDGAYHDPVGAERQFRKMGSLKTRNQGG